MYKLTKWSTCGIQFESFYFNKIENAKKFAEDRLSVNELKWYDNGPFTWKGVEELRCSVSEHLNDRYYNITPVITED
jgi:hypothetical protein